MLTISFESTACTQVFSNRFVLYLFSDLYPKGEKDPVSLL